ncbi:unnamed protein product [Sphagnum compactum]
MSNSIKSVSAVLAVLAATTLGTKAFAQAHLNIGIVDRDKVVTSYPKAQSAAEELKKSEDKIQDRAQGLESALESEIDTAIKAEAASRKVDAVFMKQAVLMGGTDMTDGVVKRLAPASASSSAATGKSASK